MVLNWTTNAVLHGCVNPQHLEPVTHLENMRRGIGVGHVWARMQKEKTHCPHGHAYDEHNTRTLANGHRTCRACDRERKAAQARAKLNG